MGTRNLTVVIKDNEIKLSQYGQWDGYFSYSGKKFLEFVKGNLQSKNKEQRNYLIEKFGEKIDTLEDVNEQYYDDIIKMSDNYNASNPNNSHPGHGAKVFYSWNTGQVGNDTTGYSNGITIGSNPNDTAYGFQIVQNMWDDRTYTRRYNGGWQSWKTLAWTSDIPTVTNYYWANVKVSASSSTSTSPTFSTCYTSNWFRSTG